MNQLKYLAILAALALGACSDSITGEETDATAESTSLYHQNPPINAFQITEYTYYGPGHEGYLLYDEYNQVNGMLEVKNSATYLFLNVVPTPPWLASQAAADAWSTAPAALDPESFTAQRTLDTPADTVQLWLPIPSVTLYGETHVVMDNNIYIAVVAATDDGHALATMENGNPYVTFRTSSYSVLPDPTEEEINEPSSSSATSAEPSSSSSLAEETHISSSSTAPAPPVSSAEVSSSSSEDAPDEILSSSSAEVAQSSSSTAEAWNICGKTADGRTIGFWKNNITKYLAGQTKGTQVSADNMQNYLDQAGITATEALALLSSHSSDPRDLLAKQLMGSRLNFARGAYMDGNASYTEAFIDWGLEMLADMEATDAELLAAKDLFDAYNNSHGGTIGMNCAL